MPSPTKRRSPKHLVFIRQLKCLGCGTGGPGFPSEAAHLRTGTDGGMALRPSDRYALPLCGKCHGLQHWFGETTFWRCNQIVPKEVAAALWEISGDVEAGERIVFRARNGINLRRVQ